MDELNKKELIEKQKNYELIELRSEEISAILGHIPGRIIKYGIMVFFIILLLLFTGSIFFPYPETINCPIVITSTNPPSHFFAKTSGHVQLYVIDKQKIEKGILLASLDNSAETNDILSLEVWIDSIKQHNSFDKLIKNPHFRLGEITPYLLNFQKTLSDYEISPNKQNKENLINSLNILNYQINRWKDIYLFYSPHEGIVSFSQMKGTNQEVNVGDIVLSIFPSQQGQIFGKLKIPVSSSGKIKEGQKVNVKLDSYPYMAYGVIKGNIDFISMIPSNGYYFAEINFPNELHSNYGYNIPFNYDMSGSVNIIVEDLSLFNRFVQPVRSAIKRK
ncbi:hypothetical protein FACS1894160_1290 [Bacteroidia bacterium]|nr:hypothetical protein FACS1894160_1290 [Bacteroidia bacterium]